jgi:hypothetical protein
MSWTGLVGLLMVLFAVAWFVVPGFGNMFNAARSEVGSQIAGNLPKGMREGIKNGIKVKADDELKDNMVVVALVSQEYKAAEENAKQTLEIYQTTKNFGQELVAFLDDESRGDKFVYLPLNREYTREEGKNLLGNLVMETEMKKANLEKANALAKAKYDAFKAAESKLEALKLAIHNANLDIIRAATLDTQADTTEATNVVLSDSAVGELQTEAKDMLAKAQARLTVANAQKVTNSVIESAGKPIPQDNMDLARKVFGDAEAK